MHLEFGKRCTQLRKERGYTRTAFAEKLGIPQTTLRNYELGIHEPGHSFLIQVAKEFGVTTDFLVGLTDEPQRAKKFPASAEPEAGERWQRLQNTFELLNETGQNRLVEYAGFLMSKEEYRKDSPHLVSDKDSEQKPVETVRVFQAARSSNNIPPEWVDMPKEELESIFNAPESKTDI